MNGTQIAQIQSALNKKVSALKDKKVTFEEPNANVCTWFKDSTKKHMQENGGNVGSLEEIGTLMQSDTNSAPQAILHTINN